MNLHRHYAHPTSVRATRYYRATLQINGILARLLALKIRIVIAVWWQPCSFSKWNGKITDKTRYRSHYQVPGICLVFNLWQGHRPWKLTDSVILSTHVNSPLWGLECYFQSNEFNCWMFLLGFLKSSITLLSFMCIGSLFHNLGVLGGKTSVSSYLHWIVTVKNLLFPQLAQFTIIKWVLIRQKEILDKHLADSTSRHGDSFLIIAVWLTYLYN